MINLHYNSDRVEDFTLLLDAYPDSELPKGTRSTVPFLSFWKSYSERIPWLLNQVGEGETNNTNLHFEFQVASVGKNAASQTDLMIFTDAVVIAVEGKWGEYPYETLSQWVGKEPSKNRMKVANHWLKLIAEQIGSSITSDHLASVTYQMIHRTASACHGRSKRPVLLYQSFESEDDPHPERLQNMRSFYDALKRPERLAMWLLTVPVRCSEAFSILKSQCSQPGANAPAAIRRAISE